MTITIDDRHTEILREILETAHKELMFESARADSHDYREMLHRREEAVEDVLVQLGANLGETTHQIS